MRMHRALVMGFFFWACLSMSIVTASASDAPKWFHAVAQQTAAILPADVPLAVLLNETSLTINDDGSAIWRHRFAARILNKAGVREAVAYVSYLDKKDTINAADAWICRGGKIVTTVPQREWADLLAASSGAIYDESRELQSNLVPFALPGDVFGYETEVEGPLLFLQESHTWAWPFPTALDRFYVRLPRDWSLAPIVHSSLKMEAAVSLDKQDWTWELRDRPYRPHEPWIDEASTLDGQVFLNIIPSKKARLRSLRGFENWVDVAEWEDKTCNEQCDSDANLADTVKKLTKDCSDILSKIRVLSSYVQKLRYVAINSNLGRGFGFRPRKASEVCAKGFGDCKDKSNLLRAMLREVGIKSYPVLARLQEGGEVFADWPSPYQFNHMILAIEVDDKIALPTVVETPNWGRLLIFDATDPFTLVGDLPWLLQGTKVFPIAKGSNALMQLPLLNPDTDQVFERSAKLAMSADGSIKGDCSLTGLGQAGALWRHRIRGQTAKQLNDRANERFSATLRGAIVKNVTPSDDEISGRCGIHFGFTGTKFAQFMSGGFALVKLAILNRDSIPGFAEPERRTPIELQPIIQKDEVILALPKGFKVSELPTRTVLSGPYGSYENSFEAKDDTVIFRRTLRLHHLVVSASEYAKLRQFLSATDKADQNAVLLSR